jgi:hypothetical protein
MAHLVRQQVFEIESLDLGFRATAIPAIPEATQALPLKVLYAKTDKA